MFMITINDLEGISKEKRKKILTCLDDLVTFKDSSGLQTPVISGYNFYTKPTLSDIVIKGYSKKIILESIREKGATYLWDLKYRTRDDNGIILPFLRIRNMRTGRYVNLRRYNKPLIEYKKFEGMLGSLIGEDIGWELDLPFHTEVELLELVYLFLRKSGVSLYDSKGIKIKETEEEKKKRMHWSDAYEVPVLIIGEKALMCKDKLPNFGKAIRVCLTENSNEISFIINEKLKVLRSIKYYNDLFNLGFVEEPCLVNKPFLLTVDKA